MATVTCTIEGVACCRCGATNYFPAETLSIWRKNKHGTVFYCWNCRTRQGWYGETDEERTIKSLRRQIRSLQDATEFVRGQRDRAQNSLRTTKGHLTRQKKRVAHGVCPCCNRTFKQLKSHMKRMHPEYVEENS